VQEGAGGGLVGRRGDGGLLRLVEEGAGPRGGLRHAGGGAGGGRRVRRGLLQHEAAALVAGVRVPGGVRTDGIKLNPVSTFRGELQKNIERPPQLSAASLNRRTNLCSGSTEFASDRQESREVGPPLQRNEGRGEKRGKWTRFRTIEQLTSRHQGLAGESLLQEAFDHLGLVELVAAGDQHQELLRHARRLAGRSARRPFLHGPAGGGLPCGARLGAVRRARLPSTTWLLAAKSGSGGSGTDPSTQGVAVSEASLLP